MIYEKAIQRWQSVLSRRERGSHKRDNKVSTEQFVAEAETVVRNYSTIPLGSPLSLGAQDFIVEPEPAVLME